MKTEPADTADAPDSNLDPLTGEPGAHPVGTAIGAAAAGAAGLAVTAAIAGPVGVAVATVGGAIVGGYVGKAAAELIDPTEEDTFWELHHPNQPYANPQHLYEDYQPAYRTGYHGFGTHGGSTFEEVEPQLEADYSRLGAALPWEHAREASRAAWTRVRDQRTPKIQTDATGDPRVEDPQERKDAALIV